MTPQLLVESALRGCVLGLVTFALIRLLRVRDPGHERAAWLCVLLVGTGMPLVLPLAHQSLPSASPILWFPPPPTGLSVTGREGLAAGLGAGSLFSLYLAVSALLLARLALGMFTLARLWRAATPLPRLSEDGVSVRASRSTRVPVVVAGGVLLPADWDRWSPRVLERVLAHERSHVRRGDFHWQLLACAYRSVFWASPLGWWLERRLALLAEHLSDDAALAVHGDAPAYAEILLGFSRQRREPFLAVGMARRTSLSARIGRILDRSGTVAPRRLSGPLVAAAMVVAVAASVTAPWLVVGEAAPGRMLPRLEGTLGRLPDLGPLGPLRADTEDRGP